MRTDDATDQPSDNTAAPSTSTSTDDGLAGATRTFSIITLVSRFAGMIRDVMLVRLFGDTALGSAFLAGFAIPNMFRRLFGEGALSAAFIPEYTSANKADPREARRFASLTLLLLGLTTTALTIIIEAVLAIILLTTDQPPDRALSLRLVMVMLPFMPLVCLAAILAGMLQVHGRFAPGAAGPIVLNAFIIVAGAWYLLNGRAGDPPAAYTLGVATVFSGLTQCIWFAWLLRKHTRFTRAIAGSGQRTRRMLSRFIPVVIGLGALQLSSLLDVLIAMWPIWFGGAVLGFVPHSLDDASNIILAATQRLYQFPLGVFGIAVATAAFPLLSRHADDPARFADTLRRGLRLSLFIGLPATLGLILVRDDLSWVLFAGSTMGFSDEGAARSAAVLLGYAPAVWAYSLNHVFTRAFYARGDTSTPMRISLVMVACNALLGLGLIGPLREAGLAWATSLAATAQCAILAILAQRTLGVTLFDRSTTRAMVRTAALAIAMAVCVMLVLILWPTSEAWSSRAARLVAATAVGGVVYVAVAAMTRAEELRALLKRA